MQSNPPLQFGQGPASVHHVLRLDICRGILESKPGGCGRDRNAFRNVALTELQQCDRITVLLTLGAFLEATAIAVVANPPDPAASFDLAHQLYNNRSVNRAALSTPRSRGQD